MKLTWDKCAWYLAGFFVYTVLIAMMPFLNAWLNSALIDALVDAVELGEMTILIWFILLAVFFVYLIGLMLSTLDLYLSKMLYFSIDWVLTEKINLKKLELDVAFYEDPENNNLVQRILEEFTWRVKNLTDRQFYLFQNFFEVMLAIFILGSQIWWLVPILIITNIPIFLVEAKYGNNVWHIAQSVGESKRFYNSYLTNFSNVARIIESKLFALGDYFLKKMHQIIEVFIGENKQILMRRMRWSLLAVMISEATSLLALYLFVMMVINGEITVGFLVLLLASSSRMKDSLISLFRNLARQNEDNLYVNDFFQFIDSQPVIKNSKKALPLKLKAAPEIVFENVSFSYPNTEKEILSNLNFRIKSGEKLALVGVNGAGKTTLIKLLCRFYDPTKGRILVNGVDLKDVDLGEWYATLGVLFQEYAHHSLAVEEAVAVGDVHRKFSPRKVREAALHSDAESFIKKWKRGYQQMLGKEFKDGIEPSIGQWQKLAIARVMYRNPWIYILDEPTASIDAEAEMRIFEKLEAVDDTHTVILISHRFSTVRKADKIGVIEDGNLVEFGSHAELLAAGKTYSRLFKMQAKGYE